jgi:SAM-dependent methyltransferase
VLQKVERPRLIKPPKGKPFKLDLGCGEKKQEGFLGVDRIKFECVDYVFDLTERWPLADRCVDEICSAHCLEHFTSPERCHFINELWRVLKDDGKATIVVPHWSTCRAYGDPTHQWPPMGEFFWYYLDREWRMKEAPHTDMQHLPWGYDTDFETVWGYGIAPPVLTRSSEFQTFALNHYREAVYDIHATLTKKKR